MTTASADYVSIIMTNIVIVLYQRTRGYLERVVMFPRARNTAFIPRSCTSSYLVTLAKTCFEVLDLQTFCDVCIIRLSVSYYDQHLGRFVFLPFSVYFPNCIYVKRPRTSHTCVFTSFVFVVIILLLCIRASPHQNESDSAISCLLWKYSP